MSPKLVSVCFIGVGGSTAAYGIYKHNQLEKGKLDVTVTESITVTEVTGKDTITKSTANCTTPTHKAVISNDNNVEYYVCQDIVDPTVANTTTTAVVTIEKNKTFTQNKRFASVPESSTDISTKWTYTKESAAPSIDFYWLNETSDKDIFFIKTNTGEIPLNVTTNKGIKELIEDIEKLRKERIITITTPSETTAKVVDGITCNTPKPLTNNKTEGVEYYSCLSTTEASNGTDTAPTASDGQTVFTADTVFKTKTTSSNTITKWSKTSDTTFHLYWFKPLTTNIANDKKTTIFLISSNNTDIEHDKLSKIMLEIEQFMKLQQ